MHLSELQRKITHLDKHTVELSSGDVTKPYQVFKISGEGMPYRDDPTQFGDLYVKMEVEMPKKLTKQQRDLFEQAFANEKAPREDL